MINTDCLTDSLITTIIFLTIIYFVFIPCFGSLRANKHKWKEAIQVYNTEDNPPVKLTRHLKRCIRCGVWEDDVDW